MSVKTKAVEEILPQAWHEPLTLILLEELLKEARSALTSGYVDNDAWVAVQALDYLGGAIRQHVQRESA